MIFIKFKNKVIISSCFFAVATLISALFIEDNNSIVFQLLMWLPSLFLLAVGSVGGFVSAFAVCNAAYGIYCAAQKFFNPDRIIASNTKRRFFKVAYPLYILFAMLVLAKFLTDFLFAQIVGSYIFLSLALGFLNGTILSAFSANKEQNKQKTIWIDTDEK